MAKHIHIHTHDYGTSEGAKKRWQKSAGMNTPEAHAKRAQLREQGENRAAYKASMQRQGKPTDIIRNAKPTERSAFESDMLAAASRKLASGIRKGQPAKENLTKQAEQHEAAGRAQWNKLRGGGTAPKSTPNYSAIEKADAERKRLNETKYKNVSTRPMRNTSKYFFNR